MTKEIKIRGKQYTFTANGATPLFYKQFFKKDLLKMISQNGDSMEVATDNIPELAFIMAMQADSENMMKLTDEKYYNWLSQFEPLDLTLNGGEIVQVYFGDSMPSEEPKKKENEEAKG